MNVDQGKYFGVPNWGKRGLFGPFFKVDFSRRRVNGVSRLEPT